MVTRDKISPISTRIERFRTVTPVWIHRWIWNDAQSLKQQRRGAILFFKIICQISRSHGTEICRFLPKLSVSRLLTPVWIHQWIWNEIQSLMLYSRGALLFFLRSSTKFQGCMGKEIDNLNPILSKITRPVAAIKSVRFAFLLSHVDKYVFETFSG